MCIQEAMLSQEIESVQQAQSHLEMVKHRVRYDCYFYYLLTFFDTCTLTYACTYTNALKQPPPSCFERKQPSQYAKEAHHDSWRRLGLANNIYYQDAHSKTGREKSW